MQNRRLNQKGVTLVEVLISLVITLVVFMGLIQASLLSIDSNLRNELRDAGVRIGSEYMARSRSDNWNTLVSDTPPPVTRTFRNRTQQFDLTRTVTVTDSNNKQIDITVSYMYRGETSTFRLNSVVRKPE